VASSQLVTQPACSPEVGDARQLARHDLMQHAMVVHDGVQVRPHKARGAFGYAQTAATRGGGWVGGGADDTQRVCVLCVLRRSVCTGICTHVCVHVSVRACVPVLFF